MTCLLLPSPERDVCRHVLSALFPLFKIRKEVVSQLKQLGSGRQSLPFQDHWGTQHVPYGSCHVRNIAPTRLVVASLFVMLRRVPQLNLLGSDDRDCHPLQETMTVSPAVVARARQRRLE